jgi:hypothetical protein
MHNFETTEITATVLLIGFKVIRGQTHVHDNTISLPFLPNIVVERLTLLFISGSSHA